MLAVAAGMPLFAGEFWITLLTQIMIFGLLALSADLLLGHAGPVLALPRVVLRGRRLYDRDPAGALWRADHRSPRRPGILAGTLLAFVFAFAVRTRGVYFILITLAFGYIIWGVAYRWASFTGGDNGVTNVPFPAIGALRVTSATAILLCRAAVDRAAVRARLPHRW